MGESRDMAVNYIWTDNMDPVVVMNGLKQLCFSDVPPSGVIVERAQTTLQEISLEIWPYRCPAKETNLGATVAGAAFNYVKCPVIKRLEQTLGRTVESDVKSCLAAVAV